MAEFTHQDGDEFREILGVEIERGQDGDIRCTQPAEMRKIRTAFFGDDSDARAGGASCWCRCTRTSKKRRAATSRAAADDESEDARAERAAPYRGSLLGKLGYIRITRIDVLHTLSVLAERVHRPTRRTLFGDCSWGSRAGMVSSCVVAQQMVVHGDLSTEEKRERRPFTGPVVVAETGKEAGPPSAGSASAGEMHATVAVIIKSGMVLRGIAEELLAGRVAVPLSLERRMPAGGAGASPLCTDNASNAIMTLSSQTGKKAKDIHAPVHARDDRVCARTN